MLLLHRSALSSQANNPITASGDSSNPPNLPFDNLTLDNTDDTTDCRTTLLIYITLNITLNITLDVKLDSKLDSKLKPEPMTMPSSAASSASSSASAPSRPKTALWAMDKMLNWLAALHKAAQSKHGDRAAYVHPNPITWSTAKQKNEWDGYQEDTEKRDFIAKLEKVNHHKSKVWVAVCDTPNQSYVGIELSPKEAADGVRQWDKVGWHAWGLAVVAAEEKGSAGRYAYIFDCDQELPGKGATFHVKDLTTQTQREFMKVAKAWNVKRVFVGNSGVDRGHRDRCLAETTAWVKRVALAEGAAAKEDDERFAGFVGIGLNT